MRSRMKDQEYQDIDDFAEQLVQGNEKPFMVQFKVVIADSDVKSLERKIRTFSENVRNFGFVFNLGVFRQHELIKESIPSYRVNDRYSHLLQSSNLNYLLPFNFQQIKHNHGVYYGFNYYDLSPVIYNLFSEASFSFNVIGIMGSGKSATVKNIIWNERFKGFHTVVIDPENEYIELAKGMGEDGEVFRISTQEPINVMGLVNNDWEAILDHVEGLKKFFGIFIHKDNFGQGGLLGGLLLKYYKEFATGSNKNKTDNNKQDEICLESFLDFIEIYNNETKYEAIIDDLQVLRKDREFGAYFCGTRNFRIVKPLTVFSLKNIEDKDQLFNASMIIIAQLFANTARKKDRRRLLVVDEAWKFFKNPIACEMLIGFGSMARKWRLGLACITQNITDFDMGVGTVKIISNAQTNIIMAQSNASLVAVEEKNYFELSENEIALLKLQEAGLGILHRAKEHVPIKFAILPTPWQFSETTEEEDKMLRDKGVY
jgi:type IV secretory pathway VirB4 component